MILWYGGIVGNLYGDKGHVEYCCGEGTLTGSADSAVYIGGAVGMSDATLVPVKKCVVGFDMAGRDAFERPAKRWNCSV